MLDQPVLESTMTQHKEKQKQKQKQKQKRAPISTVRFSTRLAVPTPRIEPLMGRSHPDVVPVRVVKACTIAYRTVYELNVTNSSSIFLWGGLSLLPQHQKRRSLASCVRLTSWSLQCRPANTGLIGQSGDGLSSTHQSSLLTLHRLTAKGWPMTS